MQFIVEGYPAYAYTGGRAFDPALPAIVFIEDWSRWVASFIDSAGLERPALVGHSMGSLIALETALRHHERISKLALVGTATPMPVGDAFLAAARDDSPAAFDMEAVWGHSRQSQLAQSPVPGMNLLGASRRLNGRSRPGALAAALDACNRYRTSKEALNSLQVPTLVVAGRRDQMTSFKAGNAVANEIPGARFVALDAGHSMMSEAPRELLAALREFLG